MSSLLAPSPRIVNHFLRHVLNFENAALRDKSDTNQFHVRYTRAINRTDNPQFDDLAGFNCVSSIIIDLYEGRVIDAYIKVNRSKAIRSFEDGGFQNQHLNDILQYHFNLVNIIKEFLAGGWLLRERTKKEYEDFNKKDTFIKEFNCKGFLEKCKPWNKEEKE